MAAGDLLAKRQGAFGIGYQSGGATVVRTGGPAHWLTCDSANIEFTPNVYERVNSVTENKIGIQQAGSEYSFSFSNAEVSNEQLGYLLWLFSGNGTANSVSPHTITGAFDSLYFTVYKLVGGVFDGTNNVERLVGCRFDSLSIEQGRAGYAKISGSGFGLSLSPESNAYTPTVSLGDDDAPLSWASLQAGDFQLGWDGGGLATVTAPTSVKLNFTREIERAGADVSSNNPSEIIEGGRALTIEIEMDLIEGDTDVEAAVSAAKNAENVQLYLNWVAGTTDIEITTGPCRITNSPSGEIGSGTETQMVTISAEVFDSGSGIYTVVSTDGGAAYS